MRIHITGNAGSGKSTLARQLGQKTKLPVFGLDAVVWKLGWVKSSSVERMKRESEIISQPEWIIEGVSNRVRQAADLVIFLDRTRLTCFVRCLRRNLPYLFSSRPGLPPNCPELAILPTLVRIIWNFPSLVGKKILAEASETDTRVQYIVLSSDSDVLAFLNDFRLDADRRGAILISGA